MSSWLGALRDRPIAEHERPGTLVLAALALTAATLLLALTRPGAHYHVLAADPPAARHTTALAPVLPGPVLSPSAERVSRVFLAGYLAYAYGQASGGQVHDATGALARALETRPSRVTPAMRGLRPRVVSLTASSSRAGTIAVRALVNDGGLVDYSVELRLAHKGRRLLVTGLGQG